MSTPMPVCILCDEPLPTYAEFDWHRNVEHGIDWDPCVVCAEWDERTELTEYGPAHPGCVNQVATDQAMCHYERVFEDRDSA